MLKSMTGFGGREAEAPFFGKISVELRSTNHKFLEVVFHLPEGFLALEDRMKKEIEAQLKRGRVTCGVNISGAVARVFINEKMLKEYVGTIKKIKKNFSLSGEISLDALIRLPGVLSLAESSLSKARIWPHLKLLLNQALDHLVKVRRKEGRALEGYLKIRAKSLGMSMERVKNRFKSVMKERLTTFKTGEERAAFLKDTDISEEIERLAFHIKNFQQKLAKSSPVGKELDFIAQEMQREANTMGAKSCDTGISGQVVQMKSQIEKIREQVQNVE